MNCAVAGRMVAAAAREAYGRREHRKEPDCVTVGIGKAGLGHLLVRFRHGSSGVNAHLLDALADRAKRAACASLMATQLSLMWAWSDESCLADGRQHIHRTRPAEANK